MNEMEKLIAICAAFKQDRINIKEFQKRIETVYFPDVCKNTLEKEQHNAFNKLEEIMYSFTQSQKKYAIEVADSLIQATILEQERLKKV